MSLLPNYDPNNFIHDKILDLNYGNYPNFGLYHTITEIIKTKPLDVLRLPLEKQMLYSDAITRKYAKNEIFINNQIMNIRINKLPNTPNITNIGNMAFLAYHSPEYFKEYYDELIQCFISQLEYQK